MWAHFMLAHSETLCVICCWRICSNVLFRYSYLADRIGLSNSDVIASDSNEVEPLKASADKEWVSYKFA